jgi:hypothetical protein
MPLIIIYNWYYKKEVHEKEKKSIAAFFDIISCVLKQTERITLTRDLIRCTRKKKDNK